MIIILVLFFHSLLLKIPNMFLIAGELMPTVFHIAARSLHKHALSIHGDHMDVMHARSAGWAQVSNKIFNYIICIIKKFKILINNILIYLISLSQLQSKNVMIIL